MWSRKFYHSYAQLSSEVIRGTYEDKGEYTTFGAVEPFVCSSSQTRRPTNWATPGSSIRGYKIKRSTRRPSCCGARQSLRPSKRTCAMPTAATRSPRCICPRQRSARSPTGRHPEIPKALYTNRKEKATEKCQNSQGDSLLFFGFRMHNVNPIATK